MSYIIIKMIKNTEGKELPVVMLNGQEEVWTFETADEAIKMSELLTKNSDSGYRYYVKKT